MSEIPTEIHVFVYKEYMPFFEELGPVTRVSDHDPHNGAELSKWVRADLVPRWVSVDERLPDEDQRVLWYTPEEKIDSVSCLRVATGDMYRQLNSATHWLDGLVDPEAST